MKYLYKYVQKAAKLPKYVNYPTYEALNNNIHPKQNCYK